MDEQRSTLLLAAGHRRIGFATNEDDIPATHGRLAGYRQALAAGGIRFDRRLVVAADSTTDRRFRRSAAAARPRRSPLGVVLLQRPHGDGRLSCRGQLGLDVPEDVSIVGFDDQEPISEGLYPALTTVALPHYEMGRWATRAPDRAHRHRPKRRPEPTRRSACPAPSSQRASVAPPR